MNTSILIDYFSGIKKITTTCLMKFFKQYPELKRQIEAEIENEPNYVDIAHYIIFVAKGLSLTKCKICGKTIPANKQTIYCSYECKRKDPDLVKKMKQTCISRYGVSNPGKVESIKAKMRNTNIERYGVENAAKAKKVQDKMKQTCIVRYGVEHAIESKTVQNKIQETFDERYGGNPNKSKEVRDRIKDTCIERYGVEHVFKNKKIIEKAVNTRKQKGSTRNQLNGTHNWNSKEANEKRKNTFIKKYGVENAFSIKAVQNKIREIFNEKYGGNYPIADEEIMKKMQRSRHNLTYFRNLIRFKGIVEPMFTKDEFHGAGDHMKKYMWKCCKCGNVFEDHCYSHVPRCLKCNPHTTNYSFMELELLDFIKSFYQDAHKDRKLIAPKELDCVIDELKLAIEFNGKFWHSVERGKGNGYHLMKTKLCNEKGYRLIHIWEDEWIDCKEDIKNKLKQVLTGNESLEFNDDIIKLDRSWYNNLEIPGYALVEETLPAISERHCYKTEDCGYLIYKKII